jgi:hypothetical protein
VEAQTPSVGPGAGSAAAAEFTDIVVARDDTIRVISEETLGHYAEWLGLAASRLRTLLSCDTQVFAQSVMTTDNQAPA